MAAAINKRVDDYIAGSKVTMFAMTSCGYCSMAREVFKQQIEQKVLPRKDYKVIELLKEPDSKSIQTYLQRKTGVKTVPSIFINGVFIGGAQELKALEKTKDLRKILAGEQAAVAFQAK